MRPHVFLAERLERARAPVARGQALAAPPVDLQLELDAFVRQRHAPEGFHAVRRLGGRRLEELATRRRVRVEVEHLDGGAHRPGGRRHRAAGAVDARRRRSAGGAAEHAHLGYRGDRGQRLAAEPERGHALELLERGDLAGGVARERQRQLGGGDAAAVVGHHDAPDAALLDAQAHAACAGVDGVLEQLAYHRGRALDHFTGGDLADQPVGEQGDGAHGGGSGHPVIIGSPV